MYLFLTPRFTLFSVISNSASGSNLSNKQFPSLPKIPTVSLYLSTRVHSVTILLNMNAIKKGNLCINLLFYFLLCYLTFPSMPVVKLHRWWIHDWVSSIAGVIFIGKDRSTRWKPCFVYPGIRIWFHLLTLSAKTLCTPYVIRWIDDRNIPNNLNIETFKSSLHSLCKTEISIWSLTSRVRKEPTR